MLKLWNFSFTHSNDYQDRSLRILIIRPGETTYDSQSRIQGTLNLELTEKGQEEVDTLAEELLEEQLQFLYSSPCEPAPVTAERLAQILSIPKKILPGLQNQNQGLWQGMRVEDLQRSQPRVFRIWANCPESIFPPGGEAFHEVTKRIEATIEWILKRHHQGTVGLVVGEPLASYVRCYLKSEEAKNLWNTIGIHGLWEPVDVAHAELLAR